VTDQKDDLSETGPGASGDRTLIPPDPALIAAGWQKRFVTDAGRADESRELYEAMGFDVRVEKLSRSQFGDECEGCALSACRSYVMLYTRRKGAQTS